MPKLERWPSLSPRTILIITLITAALVFAGGLYLARRDEQVRLTGDRKPIEAIGEQMEKESSQLQRLYEKDLRHLISATIPLTDQPFKISEFCNSIVGVVQWSLVHGDESTGDDIHVATDPTAPLQLPKPTFRPKSDSAPGNEMVLSKEDLFQTDGQTSGWLADLGKPLVFWQRPDPKVDTVVILLIDPKPLRAAVDAWFAQWAKASFAPLQVRDGPLCALQSSDAVLMTTGILPTTASDFVQPVRSIFGTWSISAWDRIVVHTFYDASTILIAGFLSLLITLLGVIAYLQQARLLVQTAQRVTFVNRVSHELRSPLTNILLNLELSREILAESVGPPLHRLGLVQEEAHRLRRLVDNVLTFSSIEQGRHRTERRACEPRLVLQAVIDQFAPSFARRGLEVDFRDDAATACRLDIDGVTQILSNLFSNIEKYVPGGTITVRSFLDANNLVITAADEGPGIPLREAERIFQPFERLDGGITEGASGTGLGLSIARDLAQEMGGSLKLVPSRTGASFELRLPAFASLPPQESNS